MTTRRNLLLAVLVLSVVAWLWSLLGGERISLDKFVNLLPAVMSLMGLRTEAKKVKSKRQHDAMPFRLTPSFESGLYGGLIGGAIAGLVIGITYYISSQQPDLQTYGSSVQAAGWDLVSLVFLYAAFTGAVLGGSSQLGILWFRHLATARQYSPRVFNELTGGILGGAAGGLPIGALGGWLFGQRPNPFPDPVLLMTGSVLGAICVVLGALLYDGGWRWRNVRRAFFVSLVVSGFAVVTGVLALSRVPIAQFFPWDASGTLVTEGGALLGVVMGAVLGLQIGLTLLLYRSWQGMATHPA